MNIDKLEGVALDLAVAQALGRKAHIHQGMAPHREIVVVEVGPHFIVREFAPSSDWQDGGPLIEEHCVSLKRMHKLAHGDHGNPTGEYEWAAEVWVPDPDNADVVTVKVRYGDTPLVAAMRCLVASKR